MSNGDKKVFNGQFEIVSAEGTVSRDGIHVHLTIADTDGAVYGGHLLEGCIVHTTAEIGIIKSKKIFKRIYDPKMVIKNFLFKIIRVTCLTTFIKIINQIMDISSQ